MIDSIKLLQDPLPGVVMVSFKGVITSIDNLKKITLKSGEHLSLLSFEVSDETDYIRVTLWREMADKFANILPVETGVLLKNMMIKYSAASGRKEITTSKNSTLEIVELKFNNPICNKSTENGERNQWEKIGGSKNLEILHLENRKFNSVPDSIGDLKSLKELYLCRNYDLNKLPDSLGNLHSLEVLDLEKCKLNSLPDSFQQLQSLQILNLEGNDLDNLPDWIGSITSLRELNLRGNKKLTKIPDSIGSLNNLEQLNLTQSPITSIPDTIGNLGSLRVLELYATHQLKELPDSIGNLTSLKSLILSYNRLTSLPDSIGNLKSLEELRVDDNELTALPDSIGNLENLKVLRINNNNIKYYPDTLIKLKNLNHLVWRGSAYRRPPIPLCKLAKRGVTVYPSVSMEYDRPFENLALTKSQIREFLKKLSALEACRHNFQFAKKVLNTMKIESTEQEKLLELCKKFGGYCDCEILMNAIPMLLGEETPWEDFGYGTK